METDLAGIAKALRNLDRQDARHWLRRGELLSQAKELTANDTDFRKWLSSQKIAKTTAYKALAAWRDFGSVPTSGHFSKEAMAVLAQSPEARAEAISLSKTSTVSAALARRLVAAHTPSAQPHITSASAAASPTNRERFVIDGGFTIVLDYPQGATPSDLLGAMMSVQRQIRERMTRASAA